MTKKDKESLTILAWGVGIGLFLYFVPPLLKKRKIKVGHTELTTSDISEKGITKDIKNINKSIKEIDKFLKNYYAIAIELLFDDTYSFITKDTKLNNLLREINDLQKQVFLQFRTDKMDKLLEAQAKANEYLVNKYGFSFDICLEFINNINNLSKENKFLNFQNEKKFYNNMSNVVSLEMGQVIGTFSPNIVETIRSFVNDSQIKKGLTFLPVKTKLQLYNFLIL